MAIERLHYFDQQFLIEKDFTDEQEYHLGMRRRLTRALHTPGIADGLRVLRSGARQVTVKAGIAMDRDGSEIVLETDQTVDLTDTARYPDDSTVTIGIEYHQTPVKPTSAAGVTGDTRWDETPTLRVGTTSLPPDLSVVPLASFKLAGGVVPGAANEELDGGVRRYAGSKLAPGAIDESRLDQPLGAKVNAAAAVSQRVNDHLSSASAHEAAAITAEAVPQAPVSLPAGTVKSQLVALVTGLNTHQGQAASAHAATAVSAPQINGDPNSLPGGNVNSQLGGLLTLLNLHLKAVTAAHDAAAISAAGVNGSPNSLPGGTVLAQLGALLGALNTHAAASGTAHSAPAVGGTPYSLAQGNVVTQLASLLGAVNGHASAAASAHAGAAISAPAVAGSPYALVAGTVTAQLAVLLNAVNVHTHAYAATDHRHDPIYLREEYTGTSPVQPGGEWVIPKPFTQAPAHVTFWATEGEYILHGPRVASIEIAVLPYGSSNSVTYKVIVRNRAAAGTPARNVTVRVFQIN